MTKTTTSIGVIALAVGTFAFATMAYASQGDNPDCEDRLANYEVWFEHVNPDSGAARFVEENGFEAFLEAERPLKLNRNRAEGEQHQHRRENAGEKRMKQQQLHRNQQNQQNLQKQLNRNAN